MAKLTKMLVLLFIIFTFTLSIKVMLQEFILTLVVFYVLFKVFGQSSSRSNFTQHNTYHHHHRDNEGEVSVKTTPQSKKSRKKGDEGEYIDFEEIK